MDDITAEERLWRRSASWEGWPIYAWLAPSPGPLISSKQLRVNWQVSSLSVKTVPAHPNVYDLHYLPHLLIGLTIYNFHIVKVKLWPIVLSTCSPQADFMFLLSTNDVCSFIRVLSGFPVSPTYSSSQVSHYTTLFIWFEQFPRCNQHLSSHVPHLGVHINPNSWWSRLLIPHSFVGVDMLMIWGWSLRRYMFRPNLTTSTNNMKALPSQLTSSGPRWVYLQNTCKL